jgi:hypothetical protein
MGSGQYEGPGLPWAFDFVYGLHGGGGIVVVGNRSMMQRPNPLVADPAHPGCTPVRTPR